MQPQKAQASTFFIKSVIKSIIKIIIKIMSEEIKPKRGRKPLSVSSAVNSGLIEDVKFEEIKETPKTNDEPITPEVIVEQPTQAAQEIPVFKQPETIHKEDDGATINFMDDSVAANTFRAATERHETSEIPDGWGASSDEINEQRDEPTDPAHALSANDLQDIAEFAIETVDTLASFGFAKLAKDNKTDDYELPPKKKKKLATMLSVILEKRQMGTGLSIEMMFLFTVIMMYIAPFKLAMKRKNEKQELEEKENAANSKITGKAANE